jgi:hypothetical protein
MQNLQEIPRQLSGPQEAHTTDCKYHSLKLPNYTPPLNDTEATMIVWQRWQIEVEDALPEHLCGYSVYSIQSWNTTVVASSTFASHKNYESYWILYALLDYDPANSKESSEGSPEGLSEESLVRAIYGHLHVRQFAPLL